MRLDSADPVRTFSSSHRRRIEQHQPDIVEYVSQIHLMLALVHAGMGVALIPASVAG